MKLPVKVYRLSVSQRNGKLGWKELGSKTYNSKAEAEKRLDHFRKRGIDCELYESEVIVWTKISTTPALEGQTQLW